MEAKRERQHDSKRCRSAGKPNVQAEAEVSELIINVQEHVQRWFERCAIVEVQEVQNVEELHKFFSSIGLFNFRLVPLGAKEVVLEFETQQEMEITIAECRDFLEQKLHGVRPCLWSTFGRTQCIWVKVWQVPLGVWGGGVFCGCGV